MKSLKAYWLGIVGAATLLVGTSTIAHAAVEKAGGGMVSSIVTIEFTSDNIINGNYVSLVANGQILAHSKIKNNMFIYKGPISTSGINEIGMSNGDSMGEPACFRFNHGSVFLPVIIIKAKVDSKGSLSISDFGTTLGGQAKEVPCS